jgi:tetratricopeptide (TPR) repeat protein
MKRSWKSTLVCAALLVACLYGSSRELKIVQQRQPVARIEEVLYVNSPDFVRRMSLGYTGLAANIYWTRTVQYFGRKAIFKAERFDLLDPLLRLTTSLDPHLIVAYHFGSVFLAQGRPYGAGEPYKAIDLVKTGIERNPTEWKLWVDLGFIHYMELKDFVAAAHALEQGSKIPGAHPFLKTSAASLAQRGGDYATARTLWTFALETTKDELIRDNAIKHLRALEVDEVVPRLEELARQYRQRSGAQARSFAELVAAGWLRRIPVDPLGMPYKLMADGRVEVADPESLPFIKKGLPPGQEPSIFDPKGARELRERKKKEAEIQNKP